MASTVRSSKGITVNGSNFLFGGYAFSASYSVGFNGPSRCSVSFLSETGEYDEGRLKARIGGSGAKSYDRINLGEWGPLRMHPLAYTVQEQPSGNVLQITYYDRSINFLDKYFVLLDKRNVPTGGEKGMNEELRTKLDGDRHIIIVGEEFIKDPSLKSVKQEDPREQSNTIRGEMLYTAKGLADAIKKKGRMGGKIPSPELDLFEEFGIINRDEKDPETGKPKGEDRAGFRGQGYLFGFNGSMRTVLSAWGQKLGFTFYWHPTQDKLFFMDLRAGFAFDDMKFCIDSILNNGKNIIGRTYNYSIEDTFSQGASAYFGRDGEVDGKSVPDHKYILDLLTYPTFKCLTDPHRVVDGVEPPRGMENEVWYDYKYLPQSQAIGSDKTERRPWEAYLTDRTASENFQNYVRLIKAAALGSDFFATYVIMKKIANRPFQEGTGDYSSPQYNAAYSGKTGADPDVAANNVAKDAKGRDIEDSLGLDLFGVMPNPEVDNLFNSSGEGDPIPPKTGTRQKLNKQDKSGNWTFGDDCLTARLLNPALQTSAQIKSDLNISSILQGILDSVFYGDTDAPNYWSFGPLEGEDFDSSTGPLKDVHDYPIINRIYLARISDNPLSSFLESPDNNHQFQILNAIARFAGRFYIGKDLITPREFKRRNYVQDNPQLFYKNIDVKDTPLGELYESFDPVHGAAAKKMPNNMIKYLQMHGGTCQAPTELELFDAPKDRPSNERNYKIIEKAGDPQDDCTVYNGEEFKDPFNTARPTIEQFLCSIYRTKRTLKKPKKQAQFGDTFAAAPTGNPNEWQVGVNTIVPTDGGSGYQSPVQAAEALKFMGIAIVKGKVKKIPPKQDPQVIVNLANSVITSVDFNTKGLWDSDVGITIEVTVEEPGAGEVEANIFGNQPAEVAKNDAIRKVNIDERNNTKIEQCCQIDLDPSVMLFDEGDQLVIPELIRPHLDRIGKFGNNPVDLAADNLQTYLKDSYCVILPYLYTIGDLEEKYGVLEGTEGSYDELDWIVDQVELGGIFESQEAGHDPTFEISEDEELDDKGNKTGNMLCGQKPLVYLMKGDKFEFTHIIRPDVKKRPGTWRGNVREDQFGSPKGQFLTPSLEDLGIGPEECCPGDAHAKQDCKDAREAEIIAAIKALCEENSFDQLEPRNGLTVTVAGTAVADAQGRPVAVSTDQRSIPGYPSIPEGLEKLDVQVDGSGETATFTLSAKRKVRIFKRTANIDKFIKLLGPRQENKLLGP